MVFNTGAALLDAIVLAVVSKEPQGTYRDTMITQDVRGGSGHFGIHPLPGTAPTAEGCLPGGV